MSVVTVVTQKGGVEYDEVISIDITESGWIVIDRGSKRHIFPSIEVIRIDEREEI